jgi:dTDP-4-dehydrorhamnose 3,5-epimerase
MKRIETNLPGVVILEPAVFHDERGFFLESYHREKFHELGIKSTFVQDNQSRSRRGVLRGLHFQLKSPQAKLCSVARGEVLDVVVDIRVGSPTFGQWTSAILSDENHRMIFVPCGFAHGFHVLSDEADFLYKCDESYMPDDQCGVLWSDPKLGIDWQIPNGQTPIVNARDNAYLPLREMDISGLPRFKN